jgi:hypothetical protein
MQVLAVEENPEEVVRPRVVRLNLDCPLQTVNGIVIVPEASERLSAVEVGWTVLSIAEAHRTELLIRQVVEPLPKVEDPQCRSRVEAVRSDADGPLELALGFIESTTGPQCIPQARQYLDVLRVLLLRGPELGHRTFVLTDLVEKRAELHPRRDIGGVQADDRALCADGFLEATVRNRRVCARQTLAPLAFLGEGSAGLARRALALVFGGCGIFHQFNRVIE